jgi:hypothetical protein
MRFCRGVILALLAGPASASTTIIRSGRHGFDCTVCLRDTGRIARVTIAALAGRSETPGECRNGRPSSQ